jgi:putative transposase
VRHYFTVWTRGGTLNRIHNGPREQVRQTEGCNADASAALVDAQALRAAETVGRSSRGYDAGKKVKGRRRHIVTDTTGLRLAVLVTAAGVQDRAAGYTLMWLVRTIFPIVKLVWADGSYASKLVDWAAARLGPCVQIVSKLAGQVGFTVLHRRRCVERTSSWISRLPAHNKGLVRAVARPPRRDGAMVDHHGAAARHRSYCSWDAT